MVRALETVAQRRFTVAEYHRMAETGILGPDERVELVRGVIRRMSPKNRAHVIASDLICDLLKEALRGRASVYQEAPHVAEEIDSEPEPDVMVCSNPDRTAYGTTRTKALLLIEVAESSLEYDRGEKASLYAEAGVPEYWVLNLVDREIEVFRDPAEGRYRQHFRATASDRVSPEPWPDVEIEVSSLFPESRTPVRMS
jgi:Uma2 family endonuclease